MILGKPLTSSVSASASAALMLGLCLRMGMTLMLGVGCPGINQCGPLQASTLCKVISLCIQPKDKSYAVEKYRIRKVHSINKDTPYDNSKAPS